jgi:hypothetical protein
MMLARLAKKGKTIANVNYTNTKYLSKYRYYELFMWPGLITWLSWKRLAKDEFPRPENRAEAEELGAEELKMLLSGIDFFRAHKQLYYKRV